MLAGTVHFFNRRSLQDTESYEFCRLVLYNNKGWDFPVLYEHNAQALLQKQLIWIYTVFKGRTYPGSAGLGVNIIRGIVRILQFFFYQIITLIIICSDNLFLTTQIYLKELTKQNFPQFAYYMVKCLHRSRLEDYQDMFVFFFLMLNTQLSMKFSLLVNMKMPTISALFS